MADAIHDKLPFGGSFQKKLVALVTRSAIPSTLLFDLDASLFVNPQARRVMSLWRKLNKELGVTVKGSHIIEKAKDSLDAVQAKATIKYVKSLRKLNVSEADSAYITKELSQFIRFTRVLRVLTEDAAPLMERRDLDTLKLKLDNAFQASTPITEGIDYFHSLHDRIRTRYKKKVVIRTLIPDLDRCLQGHGMGLGEFGVIIGPSGRGKSMLMCYLTKAAMVQQFKVLYITLQLTPQVIATRMDASFAGVSLSEFDERIEEVGKKIEKAAVRFRDTLKIKFFPAMSLTVSMLKAYVLQERRAGFDPNMLVIDYGDLMVGEGGIDTNGRYFESGSVFDELLGYGQKENIAIWTASQATRNASSKKLVTIEDVAESYKKAMAAPIVLSINRSPEEKKEEKLRLYLAKNSFGIDDVVIPIKSNFSKGQFFTRKVENEFSKKANGRASY